MPARATHVPERLGLERPLAAIEEEAVSLRFNWVVDFRCRLPFYPWGAGPI
jgi:hypothetical protein